MVRTIKGITSAADRRSWFRLLVSMILVLALFSASASAGEWEQFEQPAVPGDRTAPYMKYTVYTPEPMEAGLPLVIYLHSSDGISWTAMKSQFDLPFLIADGTVPEPRAVVLVPQLPRDHNLTWSNAITSLNTIVENTIREYEVDPSRISLTGFSLGGIGLWELAALDPGRYARLLCVGGRVNAGIEADVFAACEEIRVFSSTGDLRGNRKKSEEFVAALQEAGINASFELLTLQHTEAPRLVYGDQDIQRWLWLIPEEDAEAEPAAETPEAGEVPGTPAP